MSIEEEKDMIEVNLRKIITYTKGFENLLKG